MHSRMHSDFPEIKKACHLQEQTVGNMTQAIHAHLHPCSYAYMNAHTAQMP